MKRLAHKTAPPGYRMTNGDTGVTGNGRSANEPFYRDGHMPRFEFALRSGDALRGAGVIVTPDFAQALTSIHEHAPIDKGDVITLGVPGFPPAQYECVGVEIEDGERVPIWKAAGRMAA